MSWVEDLRTHPEKFVTAKELADYYRVSDRTIPRLVHKRALEGVKVGRAVRIPTEAAWDLGPLPYWAGVTGTA